jgi:hypothetical protein
MEDVHGAVFQALHSRFDRPVQNNDYDLPAFSLELPASDTPMEFVLNPHYLLCTSPFGYLRFGPETRVFLNRLSDYIAFPQSALRGIVERTAPIGIRFIVCREFIDFLRGQTDRNYRGQFGDLVTAVDDLAAGDVLLWPLSHEQRLFATVATTAGTYGLPVTADTVVLNANTQVFTGFQRVCPYGIEFRDGDDYARFSPEWVEFAEDGQVLRFDGGGVLRGWALDQGGRVCALYAKTSGFVPPLDPKLLRFLDENETEAQREHLTVLGE